MVREGGMERGREKLVGRGKYGELGKEIEGRNGR
jgi:hypothetical protein